MFLSKFLYCCKKLELLCYAGNDASPRLTWQDGRKWDAAPTRAVCAKGMTCANVSVRETMVSTEGGGATRRGGLVYAKTGVERGGETPRPHVDNLVGKGKTPNAPKPACPALPKPNPEQDVGQFAFQISKISVERRTCEYVLTYFFKGALTGVLARFASCVRVAAWLIPFRTPPNPPPAPLPLSCRSCLP